MGNMPPDAALGIGIYSFADAARFLDAPARELRRWAHGYSYTGPDGQSRRSPALLTAPQLEATEFDGIGFRDLLELRFVKVFRGHGLSMQAIRRAAENARDLFHSSHPFTCKRFQTDGRSIFATVHEETGDETLVDIIKRQHVFAKIVEPSLYAGIDFDDQQGALRWFPIPNSRKIVLDPERSFGQPVIAGTGVPTAAIVDSLVAENGNVERVARLFGVSRDAVLKAQQFESRVSRAA